MQELIEWLEHQLEEKILHPLLVVAVFTVVFLEIHPFQDGNGRLSRVLTTLLLLKFGYALKIGETEGWVIDHGSNSMTLSIF
jgi:Fic family protein